MDGISWKEDLLDIHFNEEIEFVTMVNTVTGLGEPWEVFALVSVWKAEANFNFNHGKIDAALELYEKAAKYLSCTLIMSNANSEDSKDLAVSLHLNLTACNLKVGSFKRAFDLCSLVLNINPNNTKARFRWAKAAMEIDLTNTTFEDLTKAVSLDPNNKDIRNELGKVVQFHTSTTKGKRKLDSFEYPEGSRDCALSGERALDSPYIVQGSEEPIVAKKPLPCLSASAVTEEKPCGYGTEVLFVSDATSRNMGYRVLDRESSVDSFSSMLNVCPMEMDTDVTGTSLAPSDDGSSSSKMNDCPMELDTNVVDVSVASSGDVFKEGPHSSSFKPTHAEPMYRFVNRQSQGSNIKIPKSSYQALLQGKVISYSSHSQFSSLSVRIKPHQNARKTLKKETIGGSIPDSILDSSDCLSGTTTPDIDLSEVVDDSVCLVTDCESNHSPSAFTPIKAQEDRPTFFSVGKTHHTTTHVGFRRINHSRQQSAQSTWTKILHRQTTRSPKKATKRRGTHGNHTNFVCVCRFGSRKRGKQGTQHGQVICCPSNHNVPPGNKRKAGTYNGEDASRPFARRRLSPSTTTQTRMEYNNKGKSALQGLIQDTKNEALHLDSCLVWKV